MENLKEIATDFWNKYEKTTPKKLKLTDGFLVCVLLTGIVQFLYCALFGNFPFNSFLSGFIGAVGVFVNTVSLRMQINPNSDSFKKRSMERALADYIFTNLILFLVIMNFMG